MEEIKNIEGALEIGYHYAVYNKHVAFWGNVFSNYFLCQFEYKGMKWRSSEQAYMAEKAIFFGDYPAFLMILDAKTPAEAKKIGREVKNFDQEAWNLVSYGIMYDIVYAKFSQNKALQDVLLREDLMDKHFVEGSPVDGIWGVQVSWDDPRIDDESNWNGENRLGKVLDSVRVDLLLERTQKV